MSICAVVVTYKPDLDVLGRLLDALVPQVTSIVMVDNGSEMDLQVWNKARQSNAGELLLLGENKGIGAAHNVGIQWARNHRAEFVLLMDQDSIPMPDMVARLRSTHLELSARDIPVGALGSQFRDTENGRLSQFVKVGVLGFSILECNAESNVVDADFLVSSGSLLPLAAIETVGLMDEGLFIDLVDTEWCFRAKAKGFRIFMRWGSNERKSGSCAIGLCISTVRSATTICSGTACCFIAEVTCPGPGNWQTLHSVSNLLFYLA
jgi:rhamnosyltransferase